MRQPPRRLERRNIRIDMTGLPEARYERVRISHGALLDTEQDFASFTGSMSPYIVRDLWTDMHAGDEVGLDRRTENSPVRRVIEWAQEQVERLPDYLDLRETAEESVVGSTLATRALINTLKTLDWPTPPSDGDETTEVEREEGSTKETKRVSVNEDNSVTVTQTIEEQEPEDEGDDSDEDGDDYEDGDEDTDEDGDEDGDDSDEDGDPDEDADGDEDGDPDEDADGDDSDEDGDPDEDADGDEDCDEDGDEQGGNGPSRGGKGGQPSPPRGGKGGQPPRGGKGGQPPLRGSKGGKGGKGGQPSQGGKGGKPSQGRGGQPQGKAGKGGQGGQGGTKQVLTKTVQCGSREEAEALAKKVLAQAKAQGFGNEQKVDASIEEFEQKVEEMIDTLAAHRNDLRKEAAKEFAKAAAETREIGEVFRVTYGNGEGERAMAEPSADDIAFAALLAENRQLREFMRLVGRFSKLFKKSKRRERVQGGVLPRGTERAKDLSRLLPSEVALLGTALRMEQMARIAEGRARGYKTTRMAQRGQGPFEIALDNSGSMDFSDGDFEPTVKWAMARAFACAAALYAADNKRKVGLTIFNDGAWSVDCDLSGKRGRVAFIKSVLGLRVAGGTKFDPLLRHLAAKKLPNGADILLVSDGAGPITPALAKEYFKTHELAYIVIGHLRDSDETLTACAEGRMAVGKDLLNDPKAIAVAAEALLPK